MQREKTFGQKLRLYLMFAGPATFAFLAVVIIPFLYGAFLTFTSWDGISNAKPFVGLENYIAVMKDTDFWKSLWLTIRYMVISVILVNAIAFMLALLVTGKIRGKNFFRAGFFIPNLIGGIILGYIWQFVFDKALVFILNQIGIDSISMLSTEVGAFWALVIVTVWQYSGYMMLIYIAGLTGVSTDLLEAGKIDGCTDHQTTRYIVLPLMTQSFTICLFLTITRCFMVYDLNLSLTAGGPYGSTTLAAMSVYEKAFAAKQYGQGQTEAVVLFIITAIVAVAQAKMGKSKEVEA
ncbi:MAG: sugar ABC transporter permease [Butyrivibrio sp.]|jgi:raffinose/stachyose/melibiose transport system permease protein|nr:sugar ABC transporter permease [Butyrivibrio sp.]